VVAFATIAVLRSGGRGIAGWAARLAVAVILFAVALWMVYTSFPFPAYAGTETISIVASAVFVAGLAVDELIGSDIRKIFGL
jgi:hypothetical membrane protein